MQPDNQIVPVLPTFLQEGEVANVEEVKGSGHINYAVAFLGTLAEETKWKMFYELPAPCSWRTRGVSGWWAGTGRVPSRATWLLLLCSSQRRQHGRPDAVIFITLPRCHPYIDQIIVFPDLVFLVANLQMLLAQQQHPDVQTEFSNFLFDFFPIPKT